ncbi:MAG TPA: Gfo/Idh/MocA family oxidoreductase [Anaerolineales bacterium]
MNLDQGVQPIRVAIIGTAARSSYLYGPMLKALPGDVNLVSVWGRTLESAKKLGEGLDVPWFTDIEKLINETEPQIGIVCVAYHANGVVGLMAIEHRLHVLLETPIAHKLSEADAIIRAGRQRGLKVEVAEQFHRRPLEQLKLKLIESGLFGQVYTAFNDFAGHGYHGISVLRSYLGFNARPVQVVGAVQHNHLMPHWSRLGGEFGPREESQEHGIITFENGLLGIFHWTDVGYDSALRWWRSSRFLAEKGMGISVGVGIDIDEQLTLLSPDGQAPQFITIERQFERVDGGALVAMIAHTGNPEQPIVRWENPFKPAIKGHGIQWHDDEIGVAGCLMSLVNAVRNDTAPTYGAEQARLDQEIILAIQKSAKGNGIPVSLPLDISEDEA